MRTINIPETVVVTSRGVSVTVATAGLNDAILAELCVHGLVQKVADAASQAKTLAGAGDVAAMTLSLMDTAAKALLAGNWSRRVAGAGVDEETRVARIIVRNAFKAKVGAKSAQWAQFTGLAPQAQLDKLDSWYEASRDAFAPAVKTEMERRAKEEADKAKLAKAIDFAL